MISYVVETTQNESPSSFSSLPDEITENILARVSRWNYSSLSLVSKRFHSLLSSMEIYKTRSQLGAVETCVYVWLKLPGHPCASWFSLRTKPNNQNRTKRTGKIRFKRDSSGFSVVPIPSSSTDSYPELNHIEAVGSDMYIIGGPYEEPSSSVRILDCRHHTWRDAPNMTVARKDAETVLFGEKIYVMGGCDIDKCYAKWIEVFDIKTQSWTALPGPADDELCNHLRQRNGYQVNVFGGKIYLVTENHKEYTYEPKYGTWKLVKEILSFLFDYSVNAWCEIGNVIYSCINYGSLMWSAFEVEGGRVWRKIKGLKKLRKHLVKTGNPLELLDCGGQLLVMWDPCSISGTKRSKEIWYAKISLESRHNGCEVWGNVECVDVLTFPVESIEWCYCLTASV